MKPARRAPKASYVGFKHHLVAVMQNLGQLPKNMSAEQIPDQEICRIIDGLDRGPKSKVNKSVGARMNLTFTQVQKHYANCFRKCLYEDVLSNQARRIIDNFLNDYVANVGTENALKEVKKKLREEGYDIFPGRVDAYASIVVEQIVRRYDVELDAILPKVHPLPNISDTFGQNNVQEQVQEDSEPEIAKFNIYEYNLYNPELMDSYNDMTYFCH